MREHEDEFRNAGVNLAAVGLADQNYARLFRLETGITFPLLVDSERRAYAAAGLKNADMLHLLRRDNFAARRRAKSGGFKQHKIGANPFQLGGSFVFGPGDVDLYAHISATFGDNAPVAELLKASLIQA